MKANTTRQSQIDTTWMILLGVSGVGLCLVLAETIFDASIFFSGVSCVGLIAIGRKEGYLVGIYNSVAYSVLAYGNGLFGEVYLNLFFFLPTGVLGYLMWRRHLTHLRVVQMRSLTPLWRLTVAALCLLGTVGLGSILALNPYQNSPYVDACTNVISVLATFLMMWRFKEQWVLYIFLNTVTIILWVLRFRAGGDAGDLMILMWSVYLLNSIFGFWRWHQGANNQHSSNLQERD